MMTSEDAAPFDALSQSQCNHHVRGSKYGSKTTDLPPQRRSHWRLSLGVSQVGDYVVFVSNVACYCPILLLLAWKHIFVRFSIVE